MKKYLALLILPLVIFIASCSDSTTDPVVDQTGSVVVRSIPTGAMIFLDGVDQRKETPDTLKNLSVGNHSITLKLDGYYDSTFTINVTANTVINSSEIALQTNTQVVTYGTPVQIWETAGTDTTQPSGLDLSSGNAYGIGTGSVNRGAVDIYYTSNGFVVTSADNASGLTRKTYFNVGGASVLTDGVASTVKDGTWKSNMTDYESKYVFLYDADMHYSKIIITERGGGTPGNPAWVKVKWIYNKTKDDVRFK
ncbi:MAG: hypothetical protein COW85_01780 [Ignavibacteria bacterium CG22_combo_CG10-13_8_21_14_all_37_15]|nr:MAG: hypothetical protein COW85_01780 [Ignavibacteria bacterium CG22_combo_CG10-13_8_21_14_all_37_15]